MHFTVRRKTDAEAADYMRAYDWPEVWSAIAIDGAMVSLAVGPDPTAAVADAENQITARSEARAQLEGSMYPSPEKTQPRPASGHMD